MAVSGGRRAWKLTQASPESATGKSPPFFPFGDRPCGMKANGAWLISERMKWARFFLMSLRIALFARFFVARAETLVTRIAFSRLWLMKVKLARIVLGMTREWGDGIRSGGKRWHRVPIVWLNSLGFPGLLLSVFSRSFAPGNLLLFFSFLLLEAILCFYTISVKSLLVMSTAPTWAWGAVLITLIHKHGVSLTLQYTWYSYVGCCCISGILFLIASSGGDSKRRENKALYSLCLQYQGWQLPWELQRYFRLKIAISAGVH